MKRPNSEKMLQTFRTWMGMPTYKEERRFLETHLELLAPGTLTSLRRRLRTTLRATRQAIQTAPEENEWQKLTRYLNVLSEIVKRGRTVEAVRLIYVDLHGGLTLDTPEWLEQDLAQLAGIAQSDEVD